MNTEIRMIPVGYGSFVSSGRIVAIVSPESAPVKRTIQEAREERRLIDATFGKKTKSVIVMDSDHLILSALAPERLRRAAAEEDETAEMEETDDA